MSSGYGENSKHSANSKEYRESPYWDNVERLKREEIAKQQKEACGYMTPEEIGEAQRKAIEGGDKNGQTTSSI